MARTVVTQDMIKQINELYLKIKTYSGVAREVGIAPTTVKKYIIPNYQSEENIKKVVFKKEDIPELSFEKFKNLEDWGSLCNLTDEEKEEVKELWNEILM